MLVLQAGAVFRNQKPVDVPRSAMLDLNLPIQSVAGARTRIRRRRRAIVRAFADLRRPFTSGAPTLGGIFIRTRLSTIDQHSEILERCGVGFVARRIGGIPGG